MGRLQEAEAALADRSAELQSKERQAQMQADAKVQATVGAAQVKAQADTETAAIQAEAGVMQAAMQPALPTHPAYGMGGAPMPAPAPRPKPAAAPAAPDALAMLMPVLIGMQQQLAALSAERQQPKQAQGPMELVPERDPVTGKAVRYIARPMVH